MSFLLFMNKSYTDIPERIQVQLERLCELKKAVKWLDKKIDPEHVAIQKIMDIPIDLFNEAVYRLQEFDDFKNWPSEKEPSAAEIQINNFWYGKFVILDKFAANNIWHPYENREDLPERESTGKFIGSQDEVEIDKKVFDELRALRTEYLPFKMRESLNNQIAKIENDLLSIKSPSIFARMLNEEAREADKHVKVVKGMAADGEFGMQR